jgi:hypothetical protein
LPFPNKAAIPAAPERAENDISAPSRINVFLLRSLLHLHGEGTPIRQRESSQASLPSPNKAAIPAAPERVENNISAPSRINVFLLRFLLHLHGEGTLIRQRDSSQASLPFPNKAAIPAAPERAENDISAPSRINAFLLRSLLHITERAL